MCERVPADALPPRPVRMDRRAMLTGAGGMFLVACIGSRPRRRPPASVRVAPPAPVVVPQAPPEDPIVRRAAWGAEPLKPNHDPMNGIARITLHHTAELPDMAGRDDLELVKGVQNFHRNFRGWADIGYHYLVGRDGRIYEGRALDVQGAHAGGDANRHNLGISAIGDFQAEVPPTAQLEAIAQFLTAQQRRYGIPAREVFGHRDFKTTACPGDALYAWLTEFKARQS